MLRGHGPNFMTLMRKKVIPKLIFDPFTFCHKLKHQSRYNKLFAGPRRP